AGGEEHFISAETFDDKLIGFVRLRKPSAYAHRQELFDSSIVRELKVFGSEVPVGLRSAGEWQHRGFGSMLISEAERIAKDEIGSGRILVISGIGVREYFRKLGYFDFGPYVAKKL
ncbi:MAG: GNAT family N-acetyltransferase, partial [Thermoplasmata archaeon]